MKMFLLLALSAVFIMALAQDDKAYDWEEFKVKYNRNYSPEEEVKRKALFDENVELVKKSIDAYNNREIEFYTEIDNSSDYTLEERPYGFQVIVAPHDET